MAAKRTESPFAALIEVARAEALRCAPPARGSAAVSGHRGFEPALHLGTLEHSGLVRARRMMTLPASLVAHALVLAAAIVVPLLVAEVLPAPMEGVRAFFVEPASAPPPPPPPPPPAPRSAAVPVARPSAPPAAPAAFTAPIEVPTSIQPEEQGLELGIEGGVPGGVEGGVPGGVVGGVVGGLPEAPPIERAAVRVGGHIKEPRKIKHVDPVYPEIARDAHVQGIVIIEATIDERGRVTDARVLRGVPLLDTAALDAVRQWAYAPTLLNGVPRPVVMTVTVSFLLRRPAGA